jgi:hypothetical protein
MTATVLLAVSFLAAPPPSPAGAPPPRRIPTVTRLVQLFSGLENEWMEAVRRRDEAALSRLLGDGFEMRGALAPGEPVPAAEWARSALHDFQVRSLALSQFAARDLGSVTVVSFRLDQSAEVSGRDESGEFFVIDVWARENGAWKVVARYVDAPNGRRAVGTPNERTEIPKKY